MKSTQEAYNKAIKMAEKNLDYGNIKMYEYWRKQAEEILLQLKNVNIEESGKV